MIDGVSMSSPATAGLEKATTNSTVSDASSSQNKSSSDSPTTVSEQLASIQTTKEMKSAELQGDRITLGEQQVIKAIERANKALAGRTVSFEFSVHPVLKQVSIKVMDKDTGEVIREIPPEKTLDMTAKMLEMAGLLIDERR